MHETRDVPPPPRRRLLFPRNKRAKFPWRLLVLLALLFSVIVVGPVIVCHRRQRTRGLTAGFPPPVPEANVPALGVNVDLSQYDGRGLEEILSTLTEGQFVWIRQSFFWSEIGHTDAADGFDWSEADQLMEAVKDFPPLRLIAVLEDDPPVPPKDPDAFARFAGAFAERYGNWVDYYQIWDEPNLADQWGGGPVNAVAYADLLARSGRLIRLADPDARMLLAGLAPTVEIGPQNLSEWRYLERLYEAGAGSYFDIVAAKPYGFDTRANDRRVDESLLNVSRVVLLREVMVANGDSTSAIWASHWGWNALPAGWQGGPSIWGQTDEETQARESVALLERAREEWPWMGAMIIENLQPRRPTGASWDNLEDPRWGFALLAADGTPRPVFHSLKAWARSRPQAAPVGGYPADNRWATYEDSWVVGPLGADPRPGPPDSATGSSTSDRMEFRLDGSAVALTVRRGPYRGFLYVTVDGRPANRLPRDSDGRSYVVLYDKEWRRATIPLATGLEPGVHSVEVVAEGGQGHWPIVDWRVSAEPATVNTLAALTALGVAAVILAALAGLEVRRTRWIDVATTFLDLKPPIQVGAVLGVVGALWVTAGVSWGSFSLGLVRSAPLLIISLTALPVLAFLLALRLDLGLSLVAFTAPFYLVPENMFYGALSMVEILVLLTLAGYILGRMWFWTQLGCHPLRWFDDCPRPRIPSQVSLTDAGVALMILSAVLAGAAADQRIPALFEFRSIFLIPALYYAILRLAPLTGGARERVVDAFLLGGIGVALVGLVQMVLGSHLVVAEGGLLRMGSVYHSPNNVGLYLGRIWPFLLVGARWGRRQWRSRLSVVGLVIVTLAIVLSFSRGALLLALPASVLAIGWRAGGRNRWLAWALIAVGAVIVIPLFQIPRFAGLFDLGEGTTFLRLRLWQSTLSVIREHPLLGVGPGNFLEAYRTRYILPSAWEEFSLEHPHNVLLDYWTRLGVLGVLSGVVVQVGFWRALEGRQPRPVALCLSGSMVAALAHGLVDNAFFFPDLALALFLTLALAQRGWGAAEEG